MRHGSTSIVGFFSWMCIVAVGMLQAADIVVTPQENPNPIKNPLCG